MTPRDFPQFAKLWQEQIDPQELAELQAMSKNIERDASRKWLLEIFLVFAFAGVTCLFVWKHSPSLPAIFVYALLVAGSAWAVWRRRETIRALRAAAVDEPRVFLEKTIKNVRKEIKVYSISIYLMVPAGLFIILLGAGVRGLNSIDMILHDMLDVHFGRTMVVGAAWLLACVYFIRDNLRLREQLRRLEAMGREWDEQQALDSAEDP